MRDQTIHTPTPGVEPLPSARLTGDATAEDIESIRRRTSVFVYEWPVRLWHWVNAALIMTLIGTGWLIASPLPTMNFAEATFQFVMGYNRFIHFAAGQLLTVAFAARIYWAFVGNHHAKQLFYVPVWKKAWWKEVFHELRWYAFLEDVPKKYVGHNPLAQVAMFFFMTVGITFMLLTGWALYAEGAGQGSLPDLAMGWLIALVGNTQVLHSIHHLGMWFIVIFMMIHIYAAIREDIMSRQSMVSTMISGHRTFKDDLPE
ncbi:MAG: Ni/Fe-hydrogenase, b-type cytochrome subunit [Rhodobacteraceae bacterium]|jgi:Ni/Fe-hydrogenase 1 B-type cytochrome subunit|uniref:Probable Ni/Fe-hydrogenase B-type cytochrome subunit n=1 Tax=Salipiger profundus TaxID=1229727 RepID=A0A1U7D4E7_9RHOB|nr:MULTISPECIES: Ni/Fe-hydrogenase, b-type cytochrome subunit [Salipiger]APX23019.1 Ni/Fe-hydrogenase 1 B-type cytochrome subunit [Salipiger profundus]MAB04681.1 Ni/Fe-hydrogenase, b-type cytochrome subunit [Paracoccaceae bacterium]GGA12735.1 putative Ni/Fe-hydrogenase B-type cytochrome subunit [Salipiger profundus]SFD21191.1 Ni/Fe-hydrogenase 1 B-type cytochrome subunit [Salipiger profundus]